MVPLRNSLLIVVTSNDFVITFTRAVTSNCNGTVTGKMGNGLKVTSFF